MTHAGGRPSRIKDCEFWLTAYLSGGKRPFSDVLRAAGMQTPPFAERTLRKTKKELEFLSVRKGFGPNALFYWRDPSVPEAEPAKAADPGTAAILSAVHELKETTRLSQPPVASSSQRPKNAVRHYDPNDPEDVEFQREMKATDDRLHAEAERQKLADARMQEIRRVITTANPVELLYAANDLAEVNTMAEVVRQHLSGLRERSERGARIKRKRTTTVERVTKSVPEEKVLKGVLTPTGKMVDVTEERTTIVDDATGEMAFILTDGVLTTIGKSFPDEYEPGEDLSQEIARWEAWLATAKLQTTHYLATNF
jgi:hypothetical protein